jgi:hemerythrin-like domain-containing protein
MVRFHHAITRGLDVSLERGTEFAQQDHPDAAAFEGFLLYVQSLASVTSGHHVSEDEVAFPYLRDKLPGVPFDKLVADHHVMEGMLEQLKATSEAAASEARARDSLRRINRIMADLAGLWHPHIEIEERDLYDVEIIAGLMDVDENIRIGQQLAQAAQPSLQPTYLTVPWVLYNLAPDERSAVAAGMPATVVEQLVPITWKEQWAPMKPFLLD